MKKTDYLKFKESLELVGKTFFSLSDLKKFYKGRKESLKVLLSHWKRKKIIQNLCRNYYAFDLVKIDYLKLAHEIENDSYVSFEYALFYCNLIDQVPSVVTLATKERGRTISAANWTFEYVHLKEKFFFGYEFSNKMYIASPEKALADLLYLISRGKRMVELDTLEKEKINKKKLEKILQKFPVYVIKKAKELEIL